LTVAWIASVCSSSAASLPEKEAEIQPGEWRPSGQSLVDDSPADRVIAEPVTKAVVILAADSLVSLSKQLAAAYVESHPTVRIEVSAIGSDVVFRKLAEEGVTVVASARPPSRDERQWLRRQKPLEPVGTPIALDAVILYVSARNHAASLTVEQVAAVFSPARATWDEIGSFGHAVHLHVPRKTTGPAAAFQTRVLGKTAMTRTRAEHDDPAQLLAAVADDPRALGLSNRAGAEGVRALAIRKAANSAPVAPTLDAVRTGEYPFAYYLYWYTLGQPNEVVRDILKFVLSMEGQQIVRRSETGAVGLFLQSAP
jgi:phosphate transport system substrate-binding protein